MAAMDEPPDTSTATTLIDETSTIVASFDPSLLIEYLTDLAMVILDASREDLEVSLLSYPDTLQRCSRFAADPGSLVLYLRKETGDANTQTAVGKTTFVYYLTTEYAAGSTTVASIAIIKRPLPLDGSVSLQSQLQIVNLLGGPTRPGQDAVSPFEHLHALVRLAISPYFDSYTRGGEGDQTVRRSKNIDEAKTGIPLTKKKIAELELSLLHLQQNVEIPEITLPIPTLVQNAITQAQSKSIRPTTALLPQDVISDPVFLNSIQGTVNSWIKSIQAITKMTRDPSNGTASQEINFWISLENALDSIDRQLKSDGVTLTLDVLRQAKRFHATVSFIADTGLKEAAEKVQKYNQLMREFPINELLSATSLDRLQEALVLIFGHLTKKLRISPYPIRRALPLVEAISGDLDTQLHNLLSGKRLMHYDYAEFEKLLNASDEVFQTWDDQLKEFTNVAREVTRKRSEKFIPIKITPRHNETQERLQYLRAFRKAHEQLQRTVANVVEAHENSTQRRTDDGGHFLSESFGDMDAVGEVRQAYESLKDVDVLDLSTDGTELWVAAENSYNERISQVENAIIARLRERLAKATTANEMFRVFSKYNALFVRPKIRGAIQEYQTQLIENVKADIAALHDRFKLQYGNSEAHAMAQLRDLPPISGAIIWARQIERQLNTYMRRVEDVLGKGWELYAEGQKLQNESVIFRKKLDTRAIYDAWLQDVSQRQLAISGYIFKIVHNRASGSLQLQVNFDRQIIGLFKEVRNFVWLNFQVPHAISNVSKEAKRVYPYAVSLVETIRTYTQTLRKIESMSSVSTLLSGFRMEVQTLIAKGMQMKWESFVHSFDPHHRTGSYLANGNADGSAHPPVRESRHVQFVRDYALSTSTLQSKTDTLISIYDDVLHCLNELKTCRYESTAFTETIRRIQDLVDRMNLENYVNLTVWVEELNSTIEGVLLERLNEAILAWTAAFNAEGRANELYGHKGRKLGHNNLPDEVAARTKSITMEPILHELTIRNQVIFLEPPLEHARAICFSSLHEWLGVVCNIHRVQASRYELSVHRSSNENSNVSTYSTLLEKLANSQLKAAYMTVEKRLAEASAYVDRWLEFQSLWDLQADQVYSALGHDLGNWLQILTEIRKSRATFDTSEVFRSFGVIAITFDQVQSRVNQKYDAWQRDIVQRFAGVFSNAMRDLFTELTKSRTDLERQSLEASTTAQAVSFITIVQKSEQKIKIWAPLVETFHKSQNTLSRERYHFPEDWLYVDQIQGEWSALQDILARKSKQVHDQIDTLRANILAEDRLVGEKVSNLIADWNSEKPVAGHIVPEAALATLLSFESRFRNAETEYDTVAKAKDALDLAQSPPNPVLPLLDELQDFKSVWTALSKIWESLHSLRDTLWTSVAPRKVRQSLDGLVAITKDMPSRMRQYSAFEYVLGVLQKLIKINPLLSELKSDAIKERHWTKIFKACRSRERFLPSALNLGIVWDLDLSANETLLREVIVQAQGEMALEEYLRQVRETWTNYILDLVNYQSKCRLVKGWDDLFSKCGENLNSLTAMKFSPYYKVFEEDATHWEDRLNRIHVTFDIWIDVQRQWVYLEGIFAGNADIKQLLPVESSRFQNINTEFLSLMKKVSKSPYVMDVLNIPNLQKSLERLADLLTKIQKALGEYLERERAGFPRFYFVGDEDLLELIGNSRDVLRVQKHFRKMFAGLHSLILSDDMSTISGFCSKEGENITLRKPISFARNPKINEWLSTLEHEMKQSLAISTAEAIREFSSLFNTTFDRTQFLAFLDRYPAQVVLLATQVVWTRSVEEALSSQTSAAQTLQAVHDKIEHVLQALAETVLLDLEVIQRKKCEHLITEMVHQRDVIAGLLNHSVSTVEDFHWLYHMRFYYVTEGEVTDNLVIRMADASFQYGYEYLGVGERLVQTPLTDRCFLTLTQALSQRLGGSPFGPAGTGKTESVKALGGQLGRFVLVFCCDDTFDFKAMARIFLGICQVGAWGCFDEFNRLEERILSAVSQQIQSIQLGLQSLSDTGKAIIDLTGRSFELHKDTGIFITMNPGYAGRSNLPDNLKKLFRSVAMTKPDKELITQVMLYSQGFQTAKELGTKIVPFFEHCLRDLSKQTHYDFGLRALKSVLVTSGNLKRLRYQDGYVEKNTGDAEADLEAKLILQALHETVAPKLVGEDVQQLTKIEERTFPNVAYEPAQLVDLVEKIKAVAEAQHLVISDLWMTKILQLYQIQSIHHGVMMVGASGSGKSTAWRILLEALGKLDGVEGVSYVIDPKVMSKDALYGTLDSTTREWTDGLFTQVLRKIIDNVRGEGEKRHWIVFDGDVDPIWVENLNSVLDDNKMLTLPNGERLNLPSTVRIMFEVETLKYATPATVSRCGMVWFSNEIIDSEMLVRHYSELLKHSVFEDLDEDGISGAGQPLNTARDTQGVVVEVTAKYFSSQFISKALQRAKDFGHIMEFTDTRALNTLFSLIQRACHTVLEYNDQHSDFPLEYDQIEHFISRKLLLCFIWSFAGDCPLEIRQTFGDFLANMTTISVPSGNTLLDFNVTLPSATWDPWQEVVPEREVDPQDVNTSDTVIPTIDTVRHEEVLYSWMSEHRPVILCGPPGSGKTMTLFNALRKLPNFEVASINFSSATTPDLVIKSLEQYCEYRKTMNGTILAPTQIGRWLVLFCDEINLPAPDLYGTQRVISFMRQLVEQGGFWRTSNRTWITLERIQFVGACNPPTDAGRVPLSPRFLRHSPVIMVDYPGEPSLYQIYSTFVRGVLKCAPDLRGFAEPITRAMVEFYLKSQAKYTATVQSHYIYSPRELTRWIRGIYEAIRPLEGLRVEDLVRIWAHEALRLFQDRLVGEDERVWTRDNIFAIAENHFPGLDLSHALAEPIMFSNWLSRYYVSVDRENLREFTKARLKTFCEEEVDVPLVLFNDVLDHVLRIDRVFRQPQGHLILIGISGSGKTTLARFVAWMNGLKVFQIKVHGKYSAEDFDEDLKDVLRRTGCKGEKICFIMDEANVLDSAFLERMNTLLANAEIPGLFEGDEYNALMTGCKEGAQREGLLLDTPEELYRWFTQQIIKNLHVVFTMNPPESGLSSRAAASPALFNRCVLNWMGTWSDQAFYQVGMEFTRRLDLEVQGYQAPSQIPVAYRDLPLPPSHREAVVNAMVFIHDSIHQINADVLQRRGTKTYLTPRHYLDFVNHYVRLYVEKRDDLEEQQRHLNVGLEKLNDTVKKVSELRASLAEKQRQLERTNSEANAKLQQMVADQKETEQKRLASLEIQTALDQQEHAIGERTKIVLEDLANAEPAVEEARKSVSNIKKQHLSEVRAMQNPPEAVKLAMESVCSLLGNKVDGWKSVQAVIRKDDFIASIVNYDNERQMTRSLRAKMQADYLSNPAFTFEIVNRASKACGPLVQWVAAQVNYSAILDRVGPLRDEVKALESQAHETRMKAETITEMIDELEKSIARYKEEYAALISQTQSIKTEMTRVQSKVDRSMKLLDSLSSERERWDAESKAFEAQIGTLAGDVLLAAAFLSYAGLYDQQYRHVMLERWRRQLRDSGIGFKEQQSMIEYLCTADDKLQWQENSLPNDEVCLENAIILKRFDRYPLIIDPSNRVTEYLVQEFKERKLVLTSFLDDSFVKHLESAIRFGNPILIQDAEHLDPVLNHVLNKEYQKTGGRVLVRLGKQEIDFAPSFRLFLSTRNPTATFSPDVCSRVTFVNFTITKASLRTQSLNQVLKVERPDVDQKRTNLIKAQGEFRLHLRRLERKLLEALNASKGNILDDDVILDTLQTLKSEAADIARKVVKTEEVMVEVQNIMNHYEVIASACTTIYVILEQLSLLNHFYRFSLDYFQDIFKLVLASHHRDGKTSQDRIEYLVNELYITTFRWTSRSLLHRDHLVLALLLAQAASVDLRNDTFAALLSASLAPGTAVSLQRIQYSTGEEFDSEELEVVLSENRSGWDRFLSGVDSEIHAPKMNDKNQNQSALAMILVKLFRPDRLMESTEGFINSIFRTDLTAQTDYDFREVVQKTATALTPIALVSVPGYDASYKVEQLVKQANVRCTSIAMGSAEGISQAELALNSATKNGNWIFLKNVHLAPQWLDHLEKRLHGVQPHPDFKLFMTMETNPRVPVNLISMSRVFMFEPPPGIKANITNSLRGLPSSIVEKLPVERIRVYFLLAWLHAVIQERLRYVPLGWSKGYEFTEADFDAAATTIDRWIERAAAGRSNIAPEKIPWLAIGTLLSECVYGGRVDEEPDQQILSNLIVKYFTAKAFDVDFKLTNESGQVVGIPDGSRLESFKAWINKLPEREPPVWLGLPDNSERLLYSEQGKEMLKSVEQIWSAMGKEDALD